MNKINIDNILRVFRTLHRLKELPRQGFIYFRFKGDETDSIAEHSFIVAWIANLLARQLQHIKYANIDESFVHRVTKMGLIHDWSESVFGDLAYVTKSQTLEEIEHQAFKALVAKLEIHEKYRQIRKLWEKFETQKDTLEASIVKFADALDAWIQGLVTPTAWWTAWEDYNRKTENALNKKYNQPELAKIFRRICDLAKHTDVDILLPVQDLILKDDVLQRLLGFIKKIYSLKELPRHGFTIFGMKRCETDSFAAHMFTTASLSYLFSIEMEMAEREQYETIMMALIHALPVAIIGDVSYDLQAAAKKTWLKIELNAIRQLIRPLCPNSQREIRMLFNDLKNNNKTKPTCLVQIASALDAWEMGVTTPTAWMDAWIDYSQKKLHNLKKCNIYFDQALVEMLQYCYDQLAQFKETVHNKSVVGREPIIKPIRL